MIEIAVIIALLCTVTSTVVIYVVYLRKSKQIALVPQNEPKTAPELQVEEVTETEEEDEDEDEDEDKGEDEGEDEEEQESEDARRFREEREEKARKRKERLDALAKEAEGTPAEFQVVREEDDESLGWHIVERREGTEGKLKKLKSTTDVEELLTPEKGVVAELRGSADSKKYRSPRSRREKSASTEANVLTGDSPVLHKQLERMQSGEGTWESPRSRLKRDRKQSSSGSIVDTSQISNPLLRKQAEKARKIDEVIE